MGDVAGQHEPWAIRLPGDEASRKAGDNLREWAGDERGRVRRLFDRVTLRELDDPKLKGEWGEEVVAKELTRLDDAWTVLHGIRIGPKADVDHLVIGPPGVYCLNTKKLAFESRVVVSARQFRVDGYSRGYYPKAVKEAERVAGRLSAATGGPVAVRPVIVVTGVERKNYRVKAQPTDVAVVLRRDLVGWLSQGPPILPAEAVTTLARAARQPSTWDPTKVAEILDVTPPPRGPEPDPAAAPPAPDLPPPPAAPVAPLDVSVTDWRRYGHERTYVNDAKTGDRLGWRDNKTGEIHVEDGADAATVTAALEAHRP